MKVILGVDYGLARTGIARSDALGMLAHPVECIATRNTDYLIRRICEIIEESRVEEIVVGLPLNIDGSEGEMAVATRKFGDALAKESSLPVAYFDEHLSSVQADVYMEIAGVKKTKRRKEKGTRDILAARIILQDYLDANRQ